MSESMIERALGLKPDPEWPGNDIYHPCWVPTGKLRWFCPKGGNDNDIRLQQEVEWDTDMGYVDNTPKIWRDIPKVLE